MTHINYVVHGMQLSTFTHGP